MGDRTHDRDNITLTDRKQLPPQQDVIHDKDNNDTFQTPSNPKKLNLLFTRPTGFASSVSARASSSSLPLPSTALRDRSILTSKNTPVRPLDYRKNPTPPWPTSTLRRWPDSNRKLQDHNATTPGTALSQATPRELVPKTPASPSLAKRNVNTAPNPQKASGNAVFATPRTPTARKSPAKAKANAAKTVERLRDFAVKVKQYRFFFDCVDAKATAALTKQIKQLGGTVELFMNKNITHLITTKTIPPLNTATTKTPSRPPPHSPAAKASDSAPRAKDSPLQAKSPIPTQLGKKNGLATPARTKQAEDIITVARRFGASVWSLDRLQTIFNLLNGATAPRKLQDHIRDEKLYGISTTRDPNQQQATYRVFKDRYLLVEDISDAYKPIAVKEYREPKNPSYPPWPVIQLKDRQGRCAFLRYPTSVPEEDPSSRNDVENEDKQGAIPTKQPVQVAEDDNQQIFMEPDKMHPVHRLQGISAASGLVTASTAILPRREPLQDAKITQLGQRELKVNRQKPNRTTPRDRGKGLRKETPRQNVRVAGKVFYGRHGYCENCNVKYDVFADHVRSNTHKAWLSQANFQELDSLLAKLQRPIFSAQVDQVETCEQACQVPQSAESRNASATNQISKQAPSPVPTATSLEKCIQMPAKRRMSFAESILSVGADAHVSKRRRPSIVEAAVADNPFLVEPAVDMPRVIGAPASKDIPQLIPGSATVHNPETVDATDKRKKLPMLSTDTHPTFEHTESETLNGSGTTRQAPVICPTQQIGSSSRQSAYRPPPVTQTVTPVTADTESAASCRVQFRIAGAPTPSSCSVQTPFAARQPHPFQSLNTTTDAQYKVPVAPPSTPQLCSHKPSHPNISGSHPPRPFPPNNAVDLDGPELLIPCTAQQKPPGDAPAESARHSDDDEVLTVGSSTPRAKYWPRSHSDFLKIVLNPEDLSPRTGRSSPRIITPRGNRPWSISSDGGNSSGLRRNWMEATPLIRRARQNLPLETPTRPMGPVIDPWTPGDGIITLDSEPLVGQATPGGAANMDARTGVAGNQGMGSQITVEDLDHPIPDASRNPVIVLDTSTEPSAPATVVLGSHELCIAVGSEPISSEADIIAPTKQQPLNSELMTGRKRSAEWVLDGEGEAKRRKGER